MDKETIKSYLENVIDLMEQGKWIRAYQELKFVIKNLEVKKNAS